MYDLNNRICGTIQTNCDVTRERQTEKDLNRSKSMYQIITDFAGMGIVLFREDKVLYYNNQFARFLGISGREITQKDLIQWVHPKNRTKMRQNLIKLFKGAKKSARHEFRVQNHKGQRYYRFCAQVLDYEDQPTVCLILDDVTEQKELAHKARLNELRMYHEDRLAALGTHGHRYRP